MTGTFQERARVYRGPLLDELAQAFESPLLIAAKINPDRLAELIYQHAQVNPDRMKALAMTGAQSLANRKAKQLKRKAKLR